MASSAMATRELFENKVIDLVKAAEKGSGYVIDEGLNVVAKTGLFWCLRWQVIWIQRKFNEQFGKTICIVYDVRIEQVADKIQTIFEENQVHLTSKPAKGSPGAGLLFTKLNVKTDKKYTDHFRSKLQNILKLYPADSQSSLPLASSSQLAIVGPPTTSSNLAYKWPGLEHLKITEAEIQQLEKAITWISITISDEDKSPKSKSKNYTYEVRCVESNGEQRLQIVRKKPNDKTFSVWHTYPDTLPNRVLCTLRNENGSFLIDRFIVISKKVIGRGGEREVVRCWDPIKGEYFASKPCQSSMEKYLLSYFSRQVARGLPSNITFDGDTIIEPHYMGTLTIILGNSELQDTLKKSQVMEDLLFGLAILHATHFYEAYDSKGQPVKGSASFPGFNTDIKPGNILVRKVAEQRTKLEIWGSIHSDFGMACKLKVVLGTSGFLSPLRMKAYLARLQNEFAEAYNRQYAQKDDAWSLGIVFAAILAGHTSKKVPDSDIPPLDFLEQYFLENPNAELPDRNIINLKQETVDQDLETLKKSVLKSTLPEDQEFTQELFVLTGKMLQVEGSNLPMQQALAEFIKIKDKRYPKGTVGF